MLLVVVLAGVSYLVALRLAWSALALAVSGHCEQVVVALGHRIVNTTCHGAAAHASGAISSWVGVLGLLLVAFLAIGLGSGLLMWTFARRARRASAPS